MNCDTRAAFRTGLSLWFERAGDARIDTAENHLLQLDDLARVG